MIAFLLKRVGLSLVTLWLRPGLYWRPGLARQRQRCSAL